MKILDALLVLKEQAVSGNVAHKRVGICGNLDIMVNCFYDDDDIVSAYSFVRHTCVDWKHFSGDKIYPVVLDTDCGLWEGKQLKLRLSLIDHLIAKARLLGV